MSTVGIKVDLSAFFCDERKLVMLLLDNKWKTVECLQKRIQQLYEVPNILLVNNDGYLLHPSESIDIIQLCSDLKAIKPSKNGDLTIGLHKSTKNKSKSTRCEGGVHIKEESTIIRGDSHETAVPDNLVIDEDKSKRKFPWEENGFNTSTPIVNSNQTKRIKGSKDASIQINVLKKQYKLVSSEISSTSEVSEQNDVRLSISGVEGKHQLNENNKSAERHLRKKKSENSENAQQNSDISVIIKKSRPQTPFCDTSNQIGAKVMQHIYFNEDGTTTDEVVSNDTGGDLKTTATAATNSTQCNSINTTARFHCSLENSLDQNQARKFQCKTKEMKKTKEKNTIKIKKIIVIKPANGKLIKHISEYPEVEKLAQNEENHQPGDDLTFSNLDGDTRTMQNTDNTDIENGDNKKPRDLQKQNDQMETSKDKSSTEAAAFENLQQKSGINFANEKESNTSDDITPSDLEKLEVGNQQAKSIATNQDGLTNAYCDENKSISTPNNKTLLKRPKKKDLEKVNTVLVVETTHSQSPLEIVIDAFKFPRKAAKMNESTVVSIDDDSDIGEISEIIDLNESDEGF